MLKPLTSEFLLNRGFCCMNGCKNCPYSKITVYTVTYNEEYVLPFFIRWYRKRFKDCKIVIYDNYSTDNTEKIALDNNCEVIKYDTNNELSDSKYLEIKNNCWKNADTQWVIVCDCDEFLDISLEDLNNEKTIFKSEGYNMCNVENLENICDIKHGIFSKDYSKIICWDKSKIKEINYSPGCHNCKPEGTIKYSKNVLKLLHMKFLNENYMVNRYKMFKNRMSKENIKNKWGIQYLNEEKTIRTDFKNHLNASKKIYE